MASYKWSAEAVKWLLDKCKATFLPKDQFKEAYLGWGGKDINDNISPIDAGMSSLHNANLSELCNPAGVTIEYTRDKGATWTDYGASDADKVCLMSYIGKSAVLGKTGPGGEKNTNIGLRITLNGGKMGIYAEIKKMLINFTTNGATGCTVMFEYAENDSNAGATENWVQLKTSVINGWSGWNSYSLGKRIGNSSRAGRLRMTFYITGLSQSGYSSSATVFNIILFGPNRWTVPSTLAKTGHLYSYDWQGNATFPNGLAAKTLNGHTIHSDVPAGAVFTDTKYDLATQSANGLLSSSDKKKLDGVASGANNYTHPAYTARGNGLYKVTVDAQGHVSVVVGVTKADIMNLGIPGQDTTYGLASQGANGLMSAGDKAKLDGLRKPRVYQNIQVAASVWGSGAGEVGGVWTRWANIPIDGVNASMYAQVVFNPNDHQACNFASMCATYDNRVVIFAETAPGYTITIPTIIVWDT